MKTGLTILTVVVLSGLAGCTAAEKELPGDEKELLSAGYELLTVDFQEAQTLRYKFVSTREIDVDWEPRKSGPKPDKSAVDSSSESMDLVVAYTPVEIDPYGLTTIKATCESVKVERSKGRRKDAVESLPGKTFTFTVDATGKIEDYSQLNGLIREIGKKAFRSDTTSGRVKEPDMIGDFIAGQWFLWDAVSTIEKASKGVSVGQTWKSSLPIPTPMVTRKARDVTYTLDEIRETEKGLLFSVELEFQSDLDNGTISDELRQEFEENETPLSQHVTVSVEQAGSRWLITDKLKKYPVRKEGRRLNIHEKGRLAVIRSSHSPAESVPDDWPPMPYSGAFQMSGTFGFLRGYKILSLKGRGEELFNIDAGRIEQYSQQYQTQWEASLLFTLEGAANPRITIKQNLTMKLLE